MTADTQARLAAALSNRYDIVRELGAGGMATVYLAHDLKHDRDVAIKVLSSDLAESLGRARFLREIQLAAKLNHPNILPLFDSGDAGGALFFVMPNAEGQSLRERMSAVRQLPVEEAVRIAAEVAGALDYAHRHGVVHRDIKPENIMLHDGHALVADFGIAKAVVAAASERSATLTQVGVTIGTPAYMSPEQAAGDEIDGRGDLFALGCMLFEMLTGELPFTGATAQAMIASRFVQTAPDVTAKRGAVSGAVSRTVARLLARSPDDRPATGAIVIESLQSPDRTPAAPHAEESSVAVLPFENMSAAADDEYFADGITEEIINALAQLKGLRVAARTSCFAFKGKHEDLRAVGGKLGVRTVLEGSVRKAGTRLRITAQLINVADGYHIWSERYDRELVDVFALQDEIAHAIATRLQLAMLPQSPDHTARAGPRNVEAYELLLKGRVLLGRRGRAIADAIPCFQRALDLDPDLAEAHALLGDARRLLWIYGFAPSTALIPEARASLARALALDPNQVEALATLCNIASSHDWDMVASNAFAERALAVDPRHVRTLCEHSLGITLRSSSPIEMESALGTFRRAMQIDPLNAWAAAIHAMALCCTGSFDEAIHEAERSIESDPAAFTGRWSLVWTLSAAGRDAEALAAAEPALGMSGRSPRVLAEIAAIHARRGDRASAEAIYQELQSRARTGYMPWTELGVVAASAGRVEEALPMVERGVKAREPFGSFWKSPSTLPLREAAGVEWMRRTLGFWVASST